MKILVEIDVPDEEDCKYCGYFDGGYCYLFKKINDSNLLDECLEARKKVKE